MAQYQQFSISRRTDEHRGCCSTAAPVFDQDTRRDVLSHGLRGQELIVDRCGKIFAVGVGIRIGAGAVGRGPVDGGEESQDGLLSISCSRSPLDSTQRSLRAVHAHDDCVPLVRCIHCLPVRYANDQALPRNASGSSECHDSATVRSAAPGSVLNHRWRGRSAARS